MLYAQKVVAALDASREGFSRQEDGFLADLAAYRDALAELGGLFPRQRDLEERLAAADHSVGARPMGGYDAWASSALPGTSPAQPFGVSFAHHQEARAWAESIISGVTTVAVDGSQIMPWRDASIPVALVQAGIFVNPHDGARPYHKDVVVEVLTPDDLSPSSEIQDEPETLSLAAEEIVNLRRFAIEARTLAGWMRGWRSRKGEPAPVAILDGSLIVSFALTMPPQLRNGYVSAITDLLDASESSGVPLVAYIDTSHARDLATMLRTVYPAGALPETKRIHDALIWGETLAWGDATLPFLSARGDVLADYDTYRNAIAFTYLRAAIDRPPARIEMPRWVVESADYARVLDVMRAELIAGGGYPYAIETADAVAVISIADRSRFYQLFQQFAESNNLPLSFSHKSLSKSRRR